jgi:uncharacterized protein YggT (Ycf19 family)
MGYVDFILNLAGLLLWLAWRAAKADPLGKRRPATLIGTLRRADSRKGGLGRWQLPAILAGLILLRAIFYWQIGSVSKPVWAGTLNLGAIELSFRSDAFSRMLLYSVSSFGLTLSIFYLWMLFLSVLEGPEPIHSLVRMQLGRVDRWSRGLKIILPLIVVALLWWLLSWWFGWLQIIPRPASMAHRLGEALLVGAGSYLTWKFPIALLLVLRLLNSYIYFGKHPFWNYVNLSAQTLLTPLNKIPLRAGKVDFAPVLGIAAVFFLAEVAERLLIYGCGRLSI